MSESVSDEERQLARSLRDHLEHSGGFTLHRQTYCPLRRGVSVAADPRATLQVPWPQWDHEAVAGWIHRHAGRRHREDLHLGGWLDPVVGEVALDLVHVYPESARRQAVLTGLRHQQHAVFDIGTRSLVCLAGLTASSIDSLLIAGPLGATG